VGGVAAAACGAWMVAGAGALTRRTGIAAPAVIVGAGAGAGMAAAILTFASWHRRWRSVVAAVAALAAAAAAVFGVGVQDAGALSLGTRAGCSMGLGRCLATRHRGLPLLVRSGPGQRHPVVRVVFWGATAAQRSVVLGDAANIPGLGQPLLEEYYQVHPAAYGGTFTAGGSPQRWTTDHHRASVTTTAIRAVIAETRRATGWGDTANTQWWIVTGSTSQQLGVGQAACADHLQVSGVAGAVVELPLGSCQNVYQQPVAEETCPPLAIATAPPHPPRTSADEVQITIDHEFVEAATDPSRGWKVVVAPRCGDDSLMEIADVCAINGPFISAPDYRTPAGWQPSLLKPGEHGTRARCVDPARPAAPTETAPAPSGASP
jgi:hypothetical protein